MLQRTVLPLLRYLALAVGFLIGLVAMHCFVLGNYFLITEPLSLPQLGVTIANATILVDSVLLVIAALYAVRGVTAVWYRPASEMPRIVGRNVLYIAASTAMAYVLMHSLRMTLNDQASSAPFQINALSLLAAGIVTFMIYVCVSHIAQLRHAARTSSSMPAIK